MGIKEWNSKKSESFTFGRSNSSRRVNQECIRLGRKGDRDRGDDHHNQGSKWKLLWNKIQKEKHKIFRSSYSFNNRIDGSVIAAYDPEAYLRNFDEGFERKEPEYLTRSFSARFADPSRISHT